MKLSKQAAIIERENERLRNMIDNLTEQLQEKQEYIDAADYYIDLTERKHGYGQYIGDYYTLAPESTKEICRALWAVRPELGAWRKEEPNGKAP